MNGLKISFMLLAVWANTSTALAQSNENEEIDWIRIANMGDLSKFSNRLLATVTPETAKPSAAPTAKPVKKPVKKPTDEPTDSPTTKMPTIAPTFAPTSEFDRKFSIDSDGVDGSGRPFALTAYEGLKDGGLIGMRPKGTPQASQSQVFQLDENGFLHMAFAYDLCVDADFSVSPPVVFLVECVQERRRKLQAIATWTLSSKGLVGLVGGKKYAPALVVDDKYGPLILVPPNSPLALDLSVGFGAVPITAPPTVAPTFDGQTAAPTTFLSQTFEIQSTFKFDDSLRSWCLQAVNIRGNANLNMRPCEGRKKQLWQFTEDGKIKLKNEPLYCIANVQGKILKLGYCINSADGTDPSAEDRNIATFAYDDGEITATNIRDDTFYFGFNTDTKYDPIRLQKDGASESQSSWKLNAV